MKNYIFILLVILIFLFPIASISAEGEVHNKGSIPFNFYYQV